MKALLTKLGDLVGSSGNINVNSAWIYHCISRFCFLSGDDCSLWSSDLPNSIKDNFESGSVAEDSWSVIQGGVVSSGCGQLFPHAHGESLYFNGCKTRQAISKPLDLSRARYSTQCSKRLEYHSPPGIIALLSYFLYLSILGI